MAGIHFVSGEKGGVGKSVMSRLLAQYFIDHAIEFRGFDTDQSHKSFTRFYAPHITQIQINDIESLDQIIEAVAENPECHIIVDLAAQTSSALNQWMADCEFIEIIKELGATPYFWHVMDDGRDSLTLLGKLITTLGDQVSYVVVQNFGRGKHFDELASSANLKLAKYHMAKSFTLAALHSNAMHKIDMKNTSFSNAIEDKTILGIAERQRVKVWLKRAYSQMDKLLAPPSQPSYSSTRRASEAIPEAI